MQVIAVLGGYHTRRPAISRRFAPSGGYVPHELVPNIRSASAAAAVASADHAQASFGVGGGGAVARCISTSGCTIQGMDGVLIFDGKCGMCTRVRNGLLRLNRTGRLRTEPMQKPGVCERVGVAMERLPESVWWLDSSGAVFSGAKAMNAALSTALGTQLPLWVYGLPGMGPVQEVVYRWVAAHRYRFRGVTPLCESEPEQCTSPQAS